MTIACLYGTSLLLFAIGLLGLLVRRNLIIVLLSLELILIASNLSLITGSRLWNDVEGQIAVLFAIAISATEAALGLALVLLYHRLKKTTDIDSVSEVRG